MLVLQGHSEKDVRTFSDLMTLSRIVEAARIHLKLSPEEHMLATAYINGATSSPATFSQFPPSLFPSQHRNNPVPTRICEGVIGETESVSLPMGPPRPEESMVLFFSLDLATL